MTTVYELGGNYTVKKSQLEGQKTVGRLSDTVINTWQHNIINTKDTQQYNCSILAHHHDYSADIIIICLLLTTILSPDKWNGITKTKCSSCILAESVRYEDSID